MRFFKNNILLPLLIMLYGMIGYAKTTAPPPPTGRAAKTNNPTPPYPIDEHIVLLLVVALLFGFYIIHRNKLIKKAS